MTVLKIDLGNGKFKELTFYTFAKYVLGYSKLGNVHKKWAEEAESSHKRKLFLKPRGCYKSTMFTVAYTIWRLVNNPNERILIVNATSENAEAFLREINSHFIRNPRFNELFGKIIDEKASRISTVTLTNRTVFSKEPSISTIGVLGNLVSNHYSLIVCDDIANDKDRESESIREKKKKWYLDLLSVLDPDGDIICIGTPWHYNDIYSYIENELNSKLKPEEQYLISKEGCYFEDGITPRFPSILPADVLERLKIEKGPLEFSAQYAVKVMPVEVQIFFEEDFKTFEYLGGGRVLDGEQIKEVEFVGACDLSIGKTKTADFTGLITLGKSKDGIVYIIDIVLERMPPDRTMEMIFAKHKIFDYKNYGIESNVFQSLFATQMKKYSADNQLYLPIIEVGHTSNKQLRIQSLQPLIKQGILKIRHDWKEDRNYKELVNQFLYFPLGHDDGPDACESAFSLLKKHGQFKGKPFFKATEFKANVSGFDGNLDMSKFTMQFEDPVRQQFTPMIGGM